MFAIDSKTSNQTMSSSFIARDALEGLHSGVPTRTTATLTPTTPRNIEQAFAEIPSQVESHLNQAGFVPPVIQPSNQVLQKTGGFVSIMDSKNWQCGVARVAEPLGFTLDVSPKPAQTARRNVGGRRPNKDKSISPEEEERRKVRRERNKLAAARCRKRRLDHTNELMIETDGLLEKKQGLQNEIQELQTKKEELEYILEHHICCKNKHRSESPVEVKPVIDEVKFNEPELKPPSSFGKRPTSLKVPPAFPSVTSADMPISTPSGINFNFDSLMDGGTGLTPVSGPIVPSCSVQQRNSGSLDLASPDSNKLVSL